MCHLFIQADYRHYCQATNRETYELDNIRVHGLDYRWKKKISDVND